LILTVGIVIKGVQEGLEKWIGYMMPVFTFLLVALVMRSLSLPLQHRSEDDKKTTKINYDRYKAMP